MTKTLNFTLYPGPWRISDYSTWFRNDIRDLSQLCREFIGTNYSIDIIHLADDRQGAFHRGVHTTPAVLVELPCGRLKNLGGLSEAREFLQNRNFGQSLRAELDLV